MNRKTLLITLIAVALTGFGGWMVGQRVKSPAEVAAATRPPDPSPILVPAELRELSTDVITRGTGRYAASQKVELAPSTLKSGPGTATTVPSVGQMLKEGDVAIAMSDRPVFLLTGGIPAYRDLGPGMTGRDVRQLEESLDHLGLAPGRVDGVFDSLTESAVTRLYSRAGRMPFRATEAELEQTRPTESTFLPGGRAHAGVQVPADEIVFLTGLPVRVSEVMIAAGGAPDGPILTLTNTALAIDATVPIDQARLLAVGKEVFIDEPDLNITGKGVISAIAATPGTNGADGYHVYFEVKVLEGPPTIAKASLRLRLPVSSSGKKVLAVPVTAVTLGPDGTSRVQKKQGEGFEFVTVTPRLSAGGYVEIEVVQGTLQPGDMVVVGFERSGARTGG